MIVHPPLEPPVSDPMAFDKLLTRSWALYRAVWRSLLVPPLIVLAAFVVSAVVLSGIVVAVIVSSGGLHAFSAGPHSASIAAGIIAYIVFFAIAIAMSVYLYTAIYGIAQAAWTRGSADAGDGNRAFRARGVAVLVAFVGIAGTALAAVLLALPTLGIALLALPLVTMYVLPAAVAGNSGFGSVGESFGLVRRNFGASAIAIVVLLAIQYGISFVALPFLLPLQFSLVNVAASTPPGTFPHLPVGPIVAYAVGLLLVMLLSLAYYGFYATVVVGLYRSVRAFTDARSLAGIAPPPPPMLP